MIFNPLRTTLSIRVRAFYQGFQTRENRWTLLLFSSASKPWWNTMHDFLKLLLNCASGIKYSRVFFSYFVGKFLFSIQIVFLIFKLRNLMLYLKDCFCTKLMTNASFWFSLMLAQIKNNPIAKNFVKTFGDINFYSFIFSFGQKKFTKQGSVIKSFVENGCDTMITAMLKSHCRWCHFCYMTTKPVKVKSHRNT